MGQIEIRGADPTYERRIRVALAKYPPWYVAGARVSYIEVSRRPDVLAQVAIYEHGSRHILLAPGVGDLLLKAIGHELAHGVDDMNGHPHYFSSTAVWRDIHASQAYFDIPKYRDEPLEYFADMMVKLMLLGRDKVWTTNPHEANFICGTVLPVLVENFQ
jgi:hypothetical protein